MNRLGLDVNEAAAMFTQQVIVSMQNPSLEKTPHTTILSQTAKTNKSRLRSDQHLNTMVKSIYN